MNWQILTYLLPILISLGISAAIGFFALNRHAPGAKSFGWMALMESAWVLGYLLELISPTLEMKIFWDNAQWLFTGLIPVLFLGFTLRYTGRIAQHSFRLYGLLFVPTLLLTLLFFTNDLHGLALQNARLIEQEPFSILLYDFSHIALWGSAYLYALMIASIVYLLSYFVYSQGSLRNQISMIIIGGAIPMAGTILTLLEWIPAGFQRDISPYTFAVGNILISVALFRYRMLQVAPLARNILFEQMREGMIVLDIDARIVDINPAAVAMLGLTGLQPHGLFAFDVFQPWSHLVDQIRASNYGRSVLTVGSGQGSREYAFFFSRLTDKPGRFIGNLITLREMDGTSEEFTSWDVKQTQSQVEADVMSEEKVSGEQDAPRGNWFSKYFNPPLKKDLNIPENVNADWLMAIERTFTQVMRIGAILSPIDTLLSEPDIFTSLGKFLLFFTIEATFSILAIFRSLPHKLRMTGFLAVLYSFVVVEVATKGISTEALLFSTFVIIVAGVLFESKGGWIALFVSMITLVLADGLTQVGGEVNTALGPFSSLPLLISFAISAAGLNIMLTTMWTSWHLSWKKQKQTFNLLQQERNRLDEQVKERTNNLVESEKRYRILTEMLPVAVYRDELNERGSTTYVSPQIEHLFGYSRTEWLQDPEFWHKIVFSEDYKQALASIIQCQEQGYSIVEYRIKTGDGRIAWVRDESILVQDDHGQPMYVQGTLSDITKQMIAVQRRREAEEMVGHVLENLNEVFWVTDITDGKEIYISKAASTVWGRDVDAFFEFPDAFLDSVFEEDRPLVENNLAKQAQGESTEMEYRIVRPDGSIRWVWDRSFPLPREEGEHLRIAGFISDITDLKQSQQEKEALAKEFHDLFEQSPVSLWVEDFSEVKKLLDGLRQQGVSDIKEYLDIHPEFVVKCLKSVRLLDVNQSTLNLYKAETKDDLIGDFASVFSEKSLISAKNELLNIAMGKTRFNWEGENLTVTGERMDVRVGLSTISGYEETLSKVLVSVIDVTRENEAQEILKRHNIEYEMLNQIVIDLLNMRTMGAVFQVAVERVSALLDAPYSEIMMREGDSLVVRAYTDNQQFLQGDVVGKDQAKLAWMAVETKQPAILDNYSNWSGKRNLYSPLGLHAVADFPINKGDECVGVIGLGRNEAGYPFDERQIWLGQLFSKILALVIDNVSLLETMQLQVSTLNATISAVVITDIEGTIQWANPAFSRLTGYSLDEVLGKNPRLLRSGRTPIKTYKQLWSTILSGITLTSRKF